MISAHDRFRIRCDMELVRDRAAARAFILGRQDLARDDAGILDVQLYVSGRKATLLATYADAAAQQRSYMRWMETPGRGRRSHPGHGNVYLRPRGIGAARRAAPARLDGADACDAPPGAGGPVLPALSFPSRPLPEDKD